MPGDDSDAASSRIRELEEQVQAQAQRIETLEQALDNTADQQTVKWLVAQVQGGQHEQETPTEEMTTVERYAQMPLHERAETLAASDLRASLIFENWREWSERGPYGDEALTTAQSKPAPLRHLLRERDPTVDVEAGETLHRQQVYRAMRTLHKLTEGAIRYDEDHTSPDNTDSGKCHALVLEEPGRMPTLPR